MPWPSHLGVGGRELRSCVERITQGFDDLSIKQLVIIGYDGMWEPVYEDNFFP